MSDVDGTLAGADGTLERNYFPESLAGADGTLERNYFPESLLMPRSAFLALMTHPALTRSAVCATLFATSDIIAQSQEKMECAKAKRPAQPLDLKRTSRMALYAAAIDAPATNCFVKTLEAAVPGYAVNAIATKTAITQVFWSPIAITIFLVSNALLDGLGVRGAARMMQQNWLPTLKGAWAVWPIIYGVSYAFIPSTHRVTFTAAVNVFWVAFLSRMANK